MFLGRVEHRWESEGRTEHSTIPTLAETGPPIVTRRKGYLGEAEGEQCHDSFRNASTQHVRLVVEVSQLRVLISHSRLSPDKEEEVKFSHQIGLKAQK